MFTEHKDQVYPSDYFSNLDLAPKLPQYLIEYSRHILLMYNSGKCNVAIIIVV